MPYLIFIIIGAVFVLIGLLRAIIFANKKKKCTKLVKAKVFEVVRKRVSNQNDEIATKSYVYYPVFEYNVSGKHYKQKYSKSTSKNKYSSGQKVDLYYNPENPNQYIISGESTGIIDVFFIVVGVSLIASMISFI